MLMLWFGLLGLTVTILLIPRLRGQWIERRWGRRGHQFHQTHHHPISRLGGFALGVSFLVMAATALGVAYSQGEALTSRWVIAGGALAMFGMGLWDDLRPLGAKKKLLLQILFATIVYALGIRIEVLSNPFGGAIELGLFGGMVTVFWLVAFTNLINLIDGMDGLAGGISLMLMLLLAYVGQQTGAYPLLASGVAGSLIGFLIYNFPPAKIYLGDGGAYFLGFLIGMLSISSSHKGTIVSALLAPLLVLALPILDVSLAILRRGLRGLPIFRADKGHIHHRLMEMGLSRRRALLGMYCFTIFFLLLAVSALRVQEQLLPLLVGAGMLFILIVMGRLNFSRRWFNLGDMLSHSSRMRRDVAFAMSITRWLHLEGQRGHTDGDLWHLYRFAAERMGFSEFRLELGQKTFTWRSPDYDFNYNGFRYLRFDFRREGMGLIELRARRISKTEQANVTARSSHPAPLTHNLDDERTFKLVSELLAESWHKTMIEMLRASPPPLPQAPATPNTRDESPLPPLERSGSFSAS
jgi:UDP-GlcNAc:undecaprenyl-phosphate GlcNAc-1-phosphate transferase